MSSDLEESIIRHRRNIQAYQAQIENERTLMMSDFESYLVARLEKGVTNGGFFTTLYYCTLGRIFHPDKYLLICKISEFLQTQ